MKIRSFFVMMAAALVMTNCSQEEMASGVSQGNSSQIIATIEGASRSTVTDAGVFSWATSDAISLLDESNTDTYTYSGSGDSFTSSTSQTVTNPVVAYYPANNRHTTSAFYLPASYGDSNTEYVANTHAAMMATPPTSGNTYAFMHLGGVMRFNVKNVPIGTNQFVFTATGKKITGSFDLSTETPKTISAADAGTDDSSVTINFKALTAAQDMTFYVPLPLGSYNAYKVKIAGTSNDQSFEFEHETTDLADNANTISRKTLLLMPTFTYDATNGLVKGTAAVGVIDLKDGNKSANISNSAEIVVTPGTDADATATLNYTPASNGSSVLSLSDGSAEGTESSESKGKVVVTVSETATVASLNIVAPTLTVALTAAEDASVTYNKVTALTAQNTLIIGSDVTITNLVINGGNVIIEEGATVTAITNNAERNTITKQVKDAEALSEALNGNYTDVVVVDNINITADNTITIPNGKTVTLDLNGYTISQEKECTESYNMILNKGTLTIQDNSTDGSGKISFTDTSAGGSSVWGSYTICNYGTLLIDGGTIEHLGSTGSWTNRPTNIPVQNYQGKVTVNDGATISSPMFRSLRDFTAGGEIIINGGTFKGQVWMQGLGTGSSSLTITGGDFTPTAGYDGSSVYITNGTNDINVSITGGKFNTKIGCANVSKAGVKGSVKGGIFTESAKTGTNANLIAEGYSFVSNDDETYTLTKSE